MRWPRKYLQLTSQLSPIYTTTNSVSNKYRVKAKSNNNGGKMVLQQRPFPHAEQGWSSSISL